MLTNQQHHREQFAPAGIGENPVPKSTPLIVITSDHGEPTVSSLIVANGLGIAHKVLIATIKKYLPRVERFGRVLFEKAPLKTGGGTQQVTFVNLNENQALFVGSLSVNTEQVLDFKVVLIEEFDKARKALAIHLPQAGLIQLVNDLTEKIVRLEARIEGSTKEQTRYFEAKKVADLTTEQIDTRIKTEKIVTYVTTVIRRSLNGSWEKFWESFEESYNVDIRGLERRKNESRLDVAIRHGYLNRLWDFINI